MNRIISALTVVLGASTAAFADLPYSWAHTVALAIGVAIAGIHGANAVQPPVSPPPVKDAIT